MFSSRSIENLPLRIAAASFLLQAGALFLFLDLPVLGQTVNELRNGPGSCGAQLTSGCQEVRWLPETIAIFVSVVVLILVALGIWVLRGSRVARGAGTAFEGLIGALSLFWASSRVGLVIFLWSSATALAVGLSLWQVLRKPRRSDRSGGQPAGPRL
jgi:hypothetical protein